MVHLLGIVSSFKTVSVLLAVLLCSGGMKVDAVDGKIGPEGLPGRALTQLHVPFKAVALQQLANAFLTSKKVNTSTAAAAVVRRVVQAVYAGEARPKAVVYVPVTADSKG